ncbi:phage tail protein [Muribacter muris]|uniref:phage tail protein n=1 Tax=Muribacter muris TaxID=67855 RepID=UPI001883AF93|nr:phage tail protein [Muribacter muris]MBF0783871.1 phage tail protein [Muribacter muris]MBF0826369.1 phage tail protein [Muribacter muris]
MFYIFNSEGKNTACCDMQPNLADLASRNEQAIEFNQDFEGEPVLVEGEIVIIPPAPSEFHHWDGKTWLIDEKQQKKMFNEEKARLLRKISDQTDRLKAQYLQGYSQAEIDSFYRQEREARGELPLMLLTELFEGRNDLDNIDQLKEKVIKKADLFAIIMGKTFAIKQGFEVRIEQASTLDELAKIDREIEQWQSI